jgi:hypothetical protein
MEEPMPKPAELHRFTDHYDFEADFPGETLHYLESGRKASMIWTWTNGYRVYMSSIGNWTDPDGTTSPLSDEERSEIVNRAIKYAREVQHVALIVEP